MAPRCACGARLALEPPNPCPKSPDPCLPRTPQTNAVAVYSTDTWVCESSHVLKSKKTEWSSVVMCVAPGRPRPVVYYTVEGAAGLRMLDTGVASGAAARDAREGPALKLKSENKAGILSLATYPGGTGVPRNEGEGVMDGRDLFDEGPRDGVRLHHARRPGAACPAEARCPTKARP